MMTRSNGHTSLKTIDNNWFQRLCHIVDFPNVKNYQKVLRHLYNVEFWCEPNALDENRIQDAWDLRKRYSIDIPREISILEIMVALVVRCDESFLYNPNIGCRTGFWFDQMLGSMGLSRYPDWCYEENDVNDILDTFLHRQYAPNGKGGLFTIRRPRKDLTQVDIWMQAMWWFDEYEKDCDKAEEYYGEEE